MIRLIVALGNPGSDYHATKHNIAWMFVDSLPLVKAANWKAKFKGEFCEINIKGNKTIVLKPQTYMNLSGESVQPLAAFYKISPQEILVVQDELDLPFGQCHFKMGGGLAGHNGLKSIAACLGTEDFARMRVGIGRPVHGSVSDWVLSRFSNNEQIQMDLLFEKLRGPLEDCVLFGIAKASVINKKPLV
ncbi:MAG: aminoacyl-tRNA hydrolase [Bacteriovoracaceae bacterium]|nr:aminoacyl-tRNA hydrolase [Bacteriovoracaceae bacterium]